MDAKLMNVKLMNVKLFFACSTALILWPLFSFQTQAKGETLSEIQHENAEIVSELLLPNVEQFTAPEMSSSRSLSSPRIIVRCDHLTRYEHETRYESEDFFENADGQSRRWEQQQHSAHSHSSIREILRDRTGSRSLIIEIQGQCNDIRLQVEPPYSLSHPPLPLPYPHPSQLPNTDISPEQYLEQDLDQYQDWYENQITEGNIPWIVRPGSGWHWLLRDRQDTP